MIAVTVSIVDEIANERLIDGSNTAVVIGLNLKYMYIYSPAIIPCMMYLVSKRLGELTRACRCAHLWCWRTSGTAFAPDGFTHRTYDALPYLGGRNKQLANENAPQTATAQPNQKFGKNASPRPRQPSTLDSREIFSAERPQSSKTGDSTRPSSACHTSQSWK